MISTRISKKYNVPFHFSSVQTDLLANTKQKKLTSAHLDAWIPYPEEESIGKVKTAVGRHYVDLRFTAAHKDAVLYFMNTQSMSPVDAIHQINGLSENEVTLLTLFYSHEFNRDFILAHRLDYEFDKAIFQRALKFLIKQKNLSLPLALAEMKQLSSGEICVLLDFHRYGLRADVLRSVREPEACRLYHLCHEPPAWLEKKKQKFKAALAYFTKVFKNALRLDVSLSAAYLQATNEFMQIKDNIFFELKNDVVKGLTHVESARLNFLLSHVNQGIRASDTPVALTPKHLTTFRVLRMVYLLDALTAIRETKYLSDDKLDFLRKHYSETVNHRTLRAFPFHTAFIYDWMKKFNLSIELAINELSRITPSQLVYFYLLQPYGVTLDNVLTFLKDVQYTEVKKNAAIYLISKRQMTVGDALNEVVVESDPGLIKMMKDELPALSLLRR